MPQPPGDGVLRPWHAPDDPASGAGGRWKVASMLLHTSGVSGLFLVAGNLCGDDGGDSVCAWLHAPFPSCMQIIFAAAVAKRKHRIWAAQAITWSTAPWRSIDSLLHSEGWVASLEKEAAF